MFQCKSFDFDNQHKACLLFSTSVDDPDVNLISSAGRDHYKSMYSSCDYYQELYKVKGLLRKHCWDWDAGQDKFEQPSDVW